MCRLLGYLGTKPLLMAELIDKPANSLVSQSRGAKEGCHFINADGFGISWYNKKYDSEPAIFKSVQPAWNDRNLLHLTGKTESECFVSHIRASTVGDVSFTNCHPFSHKDYSFAHNGTIRQFVDLRKELINHIDEKLFLEIKSQTDSEHFFFLIMDFLSKNNNLEESVRLAIKWVSERQVDKEDAAFSRINTITTNGDILVATKFASKDMDNLTLYYSMCDDYGIIVASEKLDDYRQNWIEVEPNNILIAKRNKDVIDVEIKSLRL